jgi:hypothetical protein
VPNPETDWDHGDVVRDREDNDPDPAIVVNTPGAPADEWDISRFDKTVAEDNPDYPPDAEIITVVYEENLREAFPNWAANNPITYATLDERSVQHYSFPDPRLEPTESNATGATNVAEASESESDPEPAPDGEADVDTTPDDEATSPATADETHASGSADASAETATESAPNEPSAAVRALERRLDDGGMTTEIEPDQRTIRATKLGDTYRVRPGEVLDGDGPLRSRLETIVDADDLYTTN